MIERIVSVIKNINKFCTHNKLFFKDFKNNTYTNIILIEVNLLRDCHITNSYIANILSKIFQAQIYGYTLKFNNFFNFFAYKLKKFLNIDYFKIYKSFNIVKFIYYKKNFFYLANLANKIFDKIKKKEDIFNIKIYSVLVGDLIYDGYLRKYNYATIDIKNKNFKYYLLNFVQIFDYWHNFIRSNPVKAIIVSDTAYEMGIFSKIAFHLNIPVFVSNPLRILRLSKQNPNLFEMKYYKRDFNKYKEREKKYITKIGKKYVKKRFLGEKTIEHVVSNLPKINLFTKSENVQKKILSNLNKTKCLIAAHHFSDAPNAWGRLLFSDFFDWLEFVGKGSKNLGYEFYLRFHPLDESSNRKFADYFVKKYNFKLIPSHISHTQLIKEGIDLVLTGFGTIGFEYAYHKIPVINASLNNPHICYNFNIHPKNKKEYMHALRNFKNYKLNFDKTQLYQYYYMRYLNTFRLYENIEFGYEALTDQSANSYNNWINNFDINIHNNLLEDIQKFISSKKYKFKNELFRDKKKYN